MTGTADTPLAGRHFSVLPNAVAEADQNEAPLHNWSLTLNVPSMHVNLHFKLHLRLFCILLESSPSRACQPACVHVRNVGAAICAGRH